jgi:hypothetical protein
VRKILVPRDAPRDLHRRTARLLPAGRCPGVVPGQAVALDFEGRPGLTPGYVYCVNYLDDIVIVEEDHQTTMQRA